jgi:hypothetical protein
VSGDTPRMMRMKPLFRPLLDHHDRGISHDRQSSYFQLPTCLSRWWFQIYSLLCRQRQCFLHLFDNMQVKIYVIWQKIDTGSERGEDPKTETQVVHPQSLKSPVRSQTHKSCTFPTIALQNEQRGLTTQKWVNFEDKETRKVPHEREIGETRGRWGRWDVVRLEVPNKDRRFLDRRGVKTCVNGFNDHVESSVMVDR